MRVCACAIVCSARAARVWAGFRFECHAVPVCACVCVPVRVCACVHGAHRFHIRHAPPGELRHSSVQPRRLRLDDADVGGGARGGVVDAAPVLLVCDGGDALARELGHQRLALRRVQEAVDDEERRARPGAHVDCREWGVCVRDSI